MQSSGHLSPCPRGLSVGPRPWPWSVAPAALLVLLLPGCRATHIVTADADGRPQFRQLSIVYDLVQPSLAPSDGSPPLDLAYTKSHPYRAAFASYSASRRETCLTRELRMTIRYPHPDGVADRGLVTLAAPSDVPGEGTTVAEQTLSRAEIDLLLVHLANGGFCDSETRPGGTTRIAVEVDGHRIEKPWTREPRLDRLAVETYDSTR